MVPFRVLLRECEKYEERKRRKAAAACPAGASRVKLRPRAAALDPRTGEAAAEEV
jgi:hypothetical protein